MCYSGKCCFEIWDGDCWQINSKEKIQAKFGHNICIIGGHCEEPDDVVLFESIDKEELKVMREEIKRGKF